MHNDQINIELKGMLKALKKRFYIIILVCLISIAIAIIYGKNRFYNYYETAATIIIGESINNKVNTFNIQDDKYINTYAKFIKTDVVIEKTIKQLNLEVSVDKLKNNITATPQKDSQFIEIKLKWHNISEAKEILKTLSSVFMEQIKIIYPTVNAKIMDNVKEPEEVIKKSTCVIISVLIGIVVSLLIIFAIEFMDNTIKEEEDIENYLKLHLLANVPLDKNMINSINIRALNRLNYSLVESYRTLRTNVEFSNINKKEKSLVITSAAAGDGKSTTSAMLAVYMALAGKKTILVDCDLRNTKTQNLFRANNLIGFTNVLLGKVPLKEAIQESEIENLYILTSGLKPPNAAEILCSEKTKELLDMLKREFEYVIIDTPPVGFITDAQILSQYVDGCLLIVSSGKSKIDEVIRSKKLIEQVNGKIFGVVLNKYADKVYDKEYKTYYGEGNKG
jgi:capsular exopolysaccharide synthesis family protein